MYTYKKIILVSAALCAIGVTPKVSAQLLIHPVTEIFLMEMTHWHLTDPRFRSRLEDQQQRQQEEIDNLRSQQRRQQNDDDDRRVRRNSQSDD